LDLEEIIVKTKTANKNKRYYLAAHRRLVNVLTSNSAFFIFAVLVLCDSATVVLTRCFKLLSFLNNNICCFINLVL